MPRPSPSESPWATFVTNAIGCFVIGVLMVVIADLPPLRPFLGVGDKEYG